MSFITGWITDKVSDYAKIGLQAGGSMAGNAVGGVGTMVENAGRSAAGGVTGGIGSVGGYINNYGESIKRSMSSDGPVSGAQKKTAVRPSGAVEKGSGQAQKSLSGAQRTAGGAQQKALPAATGGVNKALSTAGSTARSAGSAAQKTARSASQPARPGGVKSVANNSPKPPQANSRNASSGPKPVTPNLRSPANNANGPSSNPRAQQTNQARNRSTDGKVRISAASRPKPGAPQQRGNRPPVKDTSGKKHNASDPLGVGGILGDQGKGKK